MEVDDMKFSLCMIVKNEGKVIERCLDSLKGIMDEIIIVDTGSTDNTKRLASLYTDKVFDYEWNDDFSAARNFAFSKATGDYIYSADADEFLDDENRRRLAGLKEVLLPEVEIVQMIYITKQEGHPTENFERDLRPKLFKRLREFTWIEPVHETVNLNPVVYDSDIEIIHMPQGKHSGRDLMIFEKLIRQKGKMSDRLNMMYIRELYKAGDNNNLKNALEYLMSLLNIKSAENDAVMCRQIIAVLMKTYRICNDGIGILKVSLMPEASIANAEMCMELGEFFAVNGDYGEAYRWFYSAGFEAESEIDAASSGARAYLALADCHKQENFIEIGLFTREESLKKAYEYEIMAKEWKPVQ
jgi:glycosyltransferase involved in cell wall biosynthesis